MDKPLTKREHDLLKQAVLYGWDIEQNGRGAWEWDGDYLMPFRAHKTLENLVARGLMERVLGRAYRATHEAQEYRCDGPGCAQGALYDDDDRKIGLCQKCAGSGLMLIPRDIKRQYGHMAIGERSQKRLIRASKKAAEPTDG